MNAIAAEAWLDGTMRAFEDDDWKILKQLVENTADKSARKYDLKQELIYNNFYLKVMNNPRLYSKLKQKVKDLGLEFIEAKAVFTGEDFGYFADLYPGLLFWLGVHQGEKQDLHSPTFLPDEKSIDIGVDVLYDLI